MRVMRRIPASVGAVVAATVLSPFLAPSAVAAQQLTVEELLSAPFPTEMSAAPAGGRVAWVQNAEGVRNIWVAEPPDYRGRPLTRYTADDGQELGGLTWSPDAAVLVHVRGGGPNRQGEIPNPAQNPDGFEQAVWRVALAAGEPVRMGLGSSPAVSPRGDGVAFLRQGKAYWAPLDGSAEPRQLFLARGTIGNLRWSPDGSKLAFVSSRGTHAFIGVFDVEAKTLRYLTPSVDRDLSPVWSPDGKRIAFIRIPASTEVAMFQARREAQPWSILVADAATGQARTVWRTQPGAGSAFHGMAAADQLLWAVGERIVFPWERDGWSHLYAVPVAGGSATLLTPGEFEVEHVALSPDGRQIVYSSNQDDIDRRHLWRVAVGGSARPEPVTRGRGIEWAPAVTSDGRAIAFFRSDARRPAHAAIRVGAGEARDLAPGSIPADFPAAALVEPEPVIFSAADGMQIHGQLFRPPDVRPGERRPAVLFFHGGSRRQMLLGWHYLGYYHNAYALNQYLASRGFIVLSVNYRSGTGYGMEFREALNYGAAGGSEFNDVMGAGLYLRSRADVDPGRIGLWGGSYGGYLTAMGLSRASDLFAAGVDIHGVHDWNVGIQTFRPDYNPLEDPQRTRVAFEASPMARVDDWHSPVLVIHGDDDRNVRFVETVTLVEALRERGVEVEQLVFPDEVHGFLLHRSWLAAYRAAADFFQRRLGERTRTNGR